MESPLIFKTAPILEKCSDFQIDFGVNSQVQCDFGLGQSDSEIMKVCVNVFLHLLFLTVVKNFENIEVYAGVDRSSASLITSFSVEDSSESEQTTGVVFTFLYDIREMNKYEIKALFISKIKGI